MTATSVGTMRGEMFSDATSKQDEDIVSCSDDMLLERV